MEYILFILLVIVLMLVVALKNSFSSQVMVLQRKLDDLSAELRKVKLRSEAPDAAVVKPEATPAHRIPPVVAVPPSPVTPPIVPSPISETTPVATAASPLKTPAPMPAVAPPVVKKPAKPGFFERNPDLEKFIGENLANKIGIGILVLGIGFFVKYAIDQEWIGIYGRVFIGILCGGILLGLAHRLRKTFKAFSSVLVGGGIAVLYLTIAIAFHEYGIFSQTAAFIIMVLITGFAVIFSLAYDRVELAIVAILGGFASPFMVSTGERNYVVLFTYILILDAGMLVLAYYKKWNLVNIVTYAFTLLLFGSWLAASFDANNGSMMIGALVFATLFYGVFFAMNLVNNLRLQTPFKAVEITLLLSTTFGYYAAGMFILSNPDGAPYKGLFTAALGMFNFVFAYALYRKRRVDRNLVFLLIGLVLTFISLAAPVQLEGNYITLFWAAEAVLLLWLSQKSGIQLMKLASVIVTVLMVLSLVMDWEQLYIVGATDAMAPILNKPYITGLFALGSLVATLYFLRFESGRYALYAGPYKLMLTLAALLILYVSQFLELEYQLNQVVDTNATLVIIIGAYNMLFISALLLVERRLALPHQLSTANAFWGVVAIAAYLVFYAPEIVIARNGYLLHTSSAAGFAWHYVYVALLLVVALLTLRRVQLFKEFNTNTFNLYSWVYVFFFVYLASAELDHAVLSLAFHGESTMHHILTQNHKIGYPILWGVAAFIIIAIGLRTKKKHLRIISLTLLLITLVKLFLVDIRGISEGGKIAAFISLGILLLVVSFMYQRLKKFLLDDEPAVTTDHKTV